MKKRKNPLMSKDRLEMFSDGVFAIAITLLILEVKIPKHEELDQFGGLSGYLIHIWPSYVTYIISFIMIGIYWSNHHHLFTYVVKKTDHFFNIINVCFLMTIAFLPFTTAILGDFVLHPEEASAAVTVYSLGLIFPQLTIVVFFYYGRARDGIFDANLSPEFLKKQEVKLLLASLLSGIALAFSFRMPMVSLSILGSTFFMYFLPPDMPQYKDGNE